MSGNLSQKALPPSEDLFPPRLDVAHLHLRFRALEPVRLPEYAGSSWRGALGQALRRVVCVCPGEECRDCVLKASCWYPRLYETPVDGRCGLLKGYADAPHPLVPRPLPLGGECAAGDALELELVLLGRAVEAVPVLVQAAQRLARFGLGRGRGKLELTDWRPAPPAGERPWAPPAAPGRVRMEFLTPLRLRVDNRVVAGEALTFRPLFTTLARRLSLLACCHGDGTPAVDFKGLAELAEAISIDDRELDWFRWSRWSSRQGRYVDMDGLLGGMTLDLSGAPALWPWLWAGQWLHLGKGTSMGMGRYGLDVPSDRRW